MSRRIQPSYSPPPFHEKDFKEPEKKNNNENKILSLLPVAYKFFTRIITKNLNIGLRSAKTTHIKRTSRNSQRFLSNVLHTTFMSSQDVEISAAFNNPLCIIAHLHYRFSFHTCVCRHSSSLVFHLPSFFTAIFLHPFPFSILPPTVSLLPPSLSSSLPFCRFPKHTHQNHCLSSLCSVLPYNYLES